MQILYFTHVAPHCDSELNSLEIVNEVLVGALGYIMLMCTGLGELTYSGSKI